MRAIKDVMDKIFGMFPGWLKPVLIGFCALFLIMMGVGLVKGTIIPMVEQKKTQGSPVVGIEASTDILYRRTDEISINDFALFKVHENGHKSVLDPSEVLINKKYVNYVGDKMTVTFKLAEDESISCEAEISIDRRPVAEFPCGSPVLDKVKAVLYTNGELRFEGTGDIAKYDDYNYPWRDYFYQSGEDDEEELVVYITAVSFEDTITPLNMDMMFFQMQYLEYIDTLPSTVESLEYTFSGCTSLREAAKWGNCSNLINIRNVYSDDSSLEIVEPIPPSVVYAENAYRNCDSLQVAPDMTNSTNLAYCTDMFSDCEHITTVPSLAPGVVNMSNMFLYCPNLKKMPEIPESVVYMDSAFSGCIAMKTATIIPKNVISCSECFNGCKEISGLLWIDAEPEEFEGFLADAAQVEALDLQGNSRMLDVLANTCEFNALMTVDQRQVNKDMILREDAIPPVDEEELTTEEVSSEEASETSSEGASTEETSENASTEENSSEENSSEEKKDEKTK